jgi:acyl-coenzyme A synthetase/AMP-(fatty) acid ligase
MIDLVAIQHAYADRMLFSGQHTLTVADFVAMVEHEARELSGRALVHLSLSWTPRPWSQLLGALKAGCDVCLSTGPVPAERLEPFRAGRPLLILPSGGTSGEPRHVVHDAATFLSRYALLQRPCRRQLLLYAAGHMAGLDAFFQALHRGGSLVLPGAGWEALRASLREEAVQVLAATPSQLQFMLLAEVLEVSACPALEQVVYGAEPMPPALLRRLQERLPGVRFEQRFGMSELGALPTRPDPADALALFLDPPHRWRVMDGELQILTSGRLLGTLEDGLLEEAPWFATGDTAEVTATGAVRIMGRLAAQINVGGRKVGPERVESVLLEMEGIDDVSIQAEPDPLTGQRVVAEVVLAGGAALSRIRSLMRRHCLGAGLPLEAVPSRLREVPSIARTTHGKRPRGTMERLDSAPR